MDQIVVEIETAIRRVSWATAQVGRKSLQRLVVDFSRQTVSDSFLTGTTKIACLELGSARDSFQLLQARFSNSKAFFSVTGETASGVRIMPNIHYQFDLELERGRVTFSGSHDGYPSYNIAVNGTSVYDFVQRNIWQLAGKSDVFVTRRTLTLK